MSVALVTVVSGETYERYAQEMFHSAFEYFGPDPVVAHIALPGREGWPDATLYRYHVLLENWHVFDGFEYVYLIDADMRFEAPVGPEILGAIVATEHPGYVSKSGRSLPYETRPESTAAIGLADGSDRYYAGGFVGGLRTHFRELVESVVDGIDMDDRYGVMACWHDESHLTRWLWFNRPGKVLSASYCMPDNASGYRLPGCERKIVALDKTPAERGTR